VRKRKAETVQSDTVGYYPRSKWPYCGICFILTCPWFCERNIHCWFLLVQSFIWLTGLLWVTVERCTMCLLINCDDLQKKIQILSYFRYNKALLILDVQTSTVEAQRFV